MTSDQSCLFEGDLYDDGEEWSPDSCTTCKCVVGNTVCHKEECPDIVCGTQKYIPVGKCCPVCAQVLLAEVERESVLNLTLIYLNN